MPKGIPRDQSVQHTILHRMKIARGHLDHVIEMLEKGEYCIDVVHQSMAVQAALKTVDEALLKNHMETCVAHQIKTGHAHDAISEIIKVIQEK